MKLPERWEKVIEQNGHMVQQFLFLMKNSPLKTLQAIKTQLLFGRPNTLINSIN